MAAKTKEISKQQIISYYMNSCQENDVVPRSVFKFCSNLGIDDAQFYKHFGSLDILAKEVWLAFHDNTISALEEDKQYQGYDRRSKLLAYYFSFFELITLNRSYVLFCLKRKQGVKALQSLSELSKLRNAFLKFTTALIEEGNEEKKFSFTKHNTRIFSEAAWAQFLLILKFNLEDDSPGFEKTDVVIEKSINTVFDVFDHTPLENVIDLGKFLAKELIAR
jgi:hypothetical protein